MEIEGAGIFRIIRFESPPAGAGLNTDTYVAPGKVNLLAGMIAETCVLLMKVVVRSWSPTRMTEAGTKLTPVAVTMMSGPLRGLESGDIELIAGLGLPVIPWMDGERKKEMLAAVLNDEVLTTANLSVSQ